MSLFHIVPLSTITQYANAKLPLLSTLRNRTTSAINTTKKGFDKMRALLSRMDMRHLRNSDMKRLVRIFQCVPLFPSETEESKYRKVIKEKISQLPRRLRSPLISLLFSILCPTHKNLNAYLVNDIWTWLRYELNSALGKFLYPLIMCGVLTETQEAQVRQIEPVCEMWRHDFLPKFSAPPGREPIRHAQQWHYQKTQCPACMLARIGSSPDVLFALFAGMVGRITHKATNSNTTNGAFNFEKSRSKRLRFIRYWIKASGGGDAAALEAGELGLTMKRLRKEWKTEQERLRHVQYVNAGHLITNGPCTLASTPAPAQLFNDESLKCHNEINDQYQHDGDHDPSNLQPTNNKNVSGSSRSDEWSSTDHDDPKLGPKPRPSHERLFSPASSLGFNISHPCKSIPSPLFAQQESLVPLARTPSNKSDSTIRPEDSISCVGRYYPAPTQACVPRVSEHGTQPRYPHGRKDSMISDAAPSQQQKPSFNRVSRQTIGSKASTMTILSYNYGGPSPCASSRDARYDPLDHPIYDTLQTKPEILAKYRALLAPQPDPHNEQEDDDFSSLPPPHSISIYSSHVDESINEDAFEAADAETAEQEVQKGEVEDPNDALLPQTPASRTTVSDILGLYRR